MKIGRSGIEAFLTRKWTRELDYRLIKELSAFTGNRIAVRFAYEFHDDSGTWFRAYGNENWEFEADGLMCRRIASINEHPIVEADRKFCWPPAASPMTIPGSPISASDVQTTRRPPSTERTGSGS